MTVQTKSCGLAQAISANFPRYLELRKSRKSFMIDPKGVKVQSITTHGQQELWIGREKYGHFQGKKLCFLDDVVSTGGTIEAVFALAREIGVEIAVIACALTEGQERTEYKASRWSASTTSPCRARDRPHARATLPDSRRLSGALQACPLCQHPEPPRRKRGRLSHAPRPRSRPARPMLRPPEKRRQRPGGPWAGKGALNMRI